jgi:hypothetical protein
LPTTQGTHAPALPAPTAPEYLPAPHSSQSISLSAAAVVKYLPTTQSMQVTALVAAVIVEYFPATQSVQASDPVVDLNFPVQKFSKASAMVNSCGKCDRTLTFENVLPAGHAGQLPSELKGLAPQPLLSYPAEQPPHVAHAADAVVVLYVPVEQAEQPPAEVPPHPFL